MGQLTRWDPFRWDPFKEMHELGDLSVANYKSALNSGAF